MLASRAIPPPARPAASPPCRGTKRSTAVAASGLTAYTGDDILDLSDFEPPGDEADSTSILRLQWKWGNRVVGTRSVDIRSSEVTGRAVQEGRLVALVRAGGWAAIAVTLVNEGSPTSGHLEADTEAGTTRRIYETADRPDLTTSPVPLQAAQPWAA